MATFAGIPKFYRWLSERYPLLNMSVTATDAPPEIDNLYLDMNGIIHNCTHGNDPNLKLTETEMILKIFTYLDKLVQIIKPRKLVFMAIDGAPPPLHGRRCARRRCHPTHASLHRVLAHGAAGVPAGASCLAGPASVATSLAPHTPTAAMHTAVVPQGSRPAPR